MGHMAWFTEFYGASEKGRMTSKLMALVAVIIIIIIAGKQKSGLKLCHSERRRSFIGLMVYVDDTSKKIHALALVVLHLVNDKTPAVYWKEIKIARKRPSRGISKALFWVFHLFLECLYENLFLVLYKRSNVSIRLSANCPAVAVNLSK